MKKIIQFIALAMSLLIISCGDDEVITSKDLKLDKTEISLMLGTSASVTINSGNGEEKPYSKDEKIATCTKVDNTIKISALKIGKTTIIVSDAKNKNATIIVNVTKKISDLKLDLDQVNLLIGTKGKVSISEGSGDFSVTSSDQTKVTAKIDNRKIEVSGIALGKSTITVTDNKSKKTVTITVKVKASVKLEISKEDFISYKQEEEIRIYNYNTNSSVNTKEAKIKLIKITSGSGMYSVKVKEGASFIVANIENGNILIQSQSSTGLRDFGECTVRLLDDITGESKIIKVRVLNPLGVNKDSITVSLGGKSEYITFDNFPVQCKTICTINHIKIESKNPSIGTIERGQDGPGASYQGFKVLGNALGDTKIIISDGVREDIEVSVKVVKATLLVRTDDNDNRKIEKYHLIKLSTGESITFNITGSNEYTTTYTPNNLITETFVKGNNTDRISKLTIKAGSVEGEVKVSITDKTSGQKNNFTIKIKEGNVYNCDPNGKFKFEIDYKGVSHDETPLVVQQDPYTGKVLSTKYHNCIETITMNIGEIINVKFCGGYKEGDYSIYQQYMIGGETRGEILDIFNAKERQQAISTIKALKAGELVIYIRGAGKIDASVGYSKSIITYYKIIVK